MTTFAILATGPSLSQADADSVRGRSRVIAVNDSFRLAPWADALVAVDRQWWAANPDAHDFTGRKFSRMKVQGVERIIQPPELRATHSNSGLVACLVAEMLGATRILLLGFDMAGSHFFGEHKEPLTNSTPARFAGFRSQFAKWRPRGVKVLNCTPNSALRCFPAATLEAALC